MALADLLGPGAEIHSVDRDRGALRRLREDLPDRFPEARVTVQAADFTQPLQLPPLDGVLMANSLHFQRRPLPVLELVASYLKPGGRMLLVEYNSDRGNPWVPYPISYPAWERLAAQAGLQSTRLLATIPSRHLREIYSALSRKPPSPA